jgi:hypothetical protein
MMVQLGQLGGGLNTGARRFSGCGTQTAALVLVDMMGEIIQQQKNMMELLGLTYWIFITGKS